MTPGSIGRRDLLRGSLWAAGLGPLCCVTPSAPEGSFRLEAGRLVIDLRKAALLRDAGSAAAIVDVARGLNLIVIHAGRGRFAALNRSCTHGGAQCAYNRKRKTIQCTSLNHAEYDLEGRLLHGRTHGDIRRYPVRREGARLVIGLEPAG